MDRVGIHVNACRVWPGLVGRELRGVRLYDLATKLQKLDMRDSPPFARMVVDQARCDCSES